MANYFINQLFIRGAPQRLERFRDDALPKDGEQGEDSRGGHAYGPLSFLSLLPPPDALRGSEANAAELGQWKEDHWGCRYPEVDSRSLDGDCLQYYFATGGFCAHNFVVNVSGAYPDLGFTLLWRDIYSGAYGEPIEYALLVVRNGVISMDFVELSGETVVRLCHPGSTEPKADSGQDGRPHGTGLIGVLLMPTRARKVDRLGEDEGDRMNA
jgi:hypothetical protein